MKLVSELIALLMIVTAAVAATIVTYFVLSSVVRSNTPSSASLTAKVVSVELLYNGSEKLFYTTRGSPIEASCVYRIEVLLVNTGSVPITNIEFSSIPTRYDVCPYPTCTIYDPVALAEDLGYDLPTTLEPNQAARITFIVLSKTYLSPSLEPFVIRIEGEAPDGTKVAAYIHPFG